MQNITALSLVLQKIWAPLPKYKVSGIYKPQLMPQTCSTFAAYICGMFAANAFFVCKLLFWRTVLAHNVGRKYAAHSCRALFWHTMCAASLQRTVAAHCTGTQCVPKVCSAQLSRTILAHNVRRKFAAHCCRTLFLCASSLRSTVAVHCAVLPPYPPTPTPPLVYHPHCHFFLVPYPQGECEKLEPQGALIAHLSTMSTSVIS